MRDVHGWADLYALLLSGGQAYMSAIEAEESANAWPPCFEMPTKGGLS